MSAAIVSSSRPDRTALGIGLILASVLSMAFADAVVKLVSADLTVWQIFVARSLVGIPIIIGLLRATASVSVCDRRGGQSFEARSWS